MFTESVTMLMSFNVLIYIYIQSLLKKTLTVTSTEDDTFLLRDKQTSQLHSSVSP